jgi:uncharacterized protein (DUF2336 family)
MAIASLYPRSATYEHSELANPTFPPRRRTISGGSSSQSPAVRGPSRTFSTYVRANVYRFVRLVHISDSTTKNGVNQEARLLKTRRSTPKQTGQTLLKKLAAQIRRTFLLRLLASGTYCSRFQYRQGAGRRLTRYPRVCAATTHEAVISKYDARSAVRGLRSERHECSVINDNDNQQGWTYSPQGRKTCSEACSRLKNRLRKCSVFGR